MEPAHLVEPPISCTVSRSLTALTLRQLSPEARLVLDQETYVIREAERFVVYRQWMGAIALIEVFCLSEILPLLDWLEQHGYSFEVKVGQPIQESIH